MIFIRPFTYLGLMSGRKIYPHNVLMNIRHTCRNNHLMQVGVFISLLIITLSLRLPYFFDDLNDADGAIFILVGQALTEGHLPYTLIWDNKPPLGFAFFALLISLFPDSLAFIRFGGAVMVAVSAFFVFRIALGFMNIFAAFLAATLYILAASSAHLQWASSHYGAYRIGAFAGFTPASHESRW